MLTTQNRYLENFLYLRLQIFHAKHFIIRGLVNC